MLYVGVCGMDRRKAVEVVANYFGIVLKEKLLEVIFSISIRFRKLPEV